MSRKLTPEDEEILRRLKDLKDTGGQYPDELLDKRRASYKNAATGLTLGIPAAGFLRGLLRFLPQTGEGILKTVLVSALVVEAGVSAYVFRNEIRNWLVGAQTPTAVVSSYIPQQSLMSTATSTPTPTETEFFVESTKKPHPTDQGLHLGQTKTPTP